ncbi:hypothetical protein B7L13_08475 [Klebsiella oxytoca]|uniref:hypothetical protein n=1 Tax=Klebsiella oxytoca TaxID=571 RepID=UPI000F8E0458|nr:hypothetical protein [Klebsiella oxytoca]EKT8243927.1 hypothetical protein [Klebsiella oxytoca]MCW1903835.1 hypothetical protein [Klebsiella oxytoca]RUS54941.1 hypothetical protein B7L13_08475 [Klebsiella oxytoca]HBU6149840.1 hypothetical protein [Klebsiella oxytoca]HBV6740276.1 hypothetical protein [Klebsiella oxytoca]
MLKITLKRGDAIHVIFPDGTKGKIEACARCEFDFNFPYSVKITRENGALRNKPNLIKPNQK